MKVTVVSVSSPVIAGLIRAEKTVNELWEGALELSIHYAVSEVTAQKLDRLREDIAKSDFVLVDLMGCSPTVIKTVCEGLQRCAGHIVPYGNSAREYLRLGDFRADTMPSGDEAKKPDMAAMRKMQNMAEMLGKVLPGKVRDMKNYSQICKYFIVADYGNVLNMLYLILREYGGIKGLPKPRDAREVPEAALCRPETMEYFLSASEFTAAYPYDPDKPVIAMLYYGHIYPMDYSAVMSVMHKKLLGFSNVIPVAVSGTASQGTGKLRELLLETLPKKPDLLINTMSFRLSAGPMGGNVGSGTDLLAELDAPYFHPMLLSRRTVDEWRNSGQGSTSTEVLISVMLPEFDGAIETIPVAAKSAPVLNEKFDVITDEFEIIEERLQRLADKAARYISLSRKTAGEKRVAIICYNYPPGEANLFGGAFLDTFKSVSNILSELQNSGYDTQAFTPDELMSRFCAGGLVNSGRYSDAGADMLRYPLKRYSEYFKTLPERRLLEETWGPPGGAIMTDDRGDFQIPAIVSGNVLVGLQPSRGVHEEQDKLCHNKTLPPHHQYVAFYKYLRDEFKADAVIHVGTHGTLEFLKGKECGMSGDCWPDLLMGDLVHIYLYYCGNPSEAMIAKRRAHAQLVSYQPPVFVPGKLYGDYLTLSSLIDDYRHALSLSPSAAEDVLKNIRELAASLNMPGGFHEIESELYRMNASLIPSGLHVFGEAFTEAEAMEYVRGLLRFSRNGILSLRSIAATAKGDDIETLEALGDWEKVREYDETAYTVFDTYFKEGKIPEKSKELYAAALGYGRTIYNRVRKNREMEGLLHALAGGYTPAKPAGDIYRNPEVLPSGTNLVQFDQRYVPTLTAFERGVKIAENTIEAYKKEHGSYPASAAVILWGLETSRTQGETFAQVLGYLGIRLDKRSSLWEPKFEIIPIEELGRPRIDVTVNICGFFRDMFPNLVGILDDILNQLYERDESDTQSFFRAHSKHIYDRLLDEGYDPEEARTLCVSRVFGPKEGEYGTGITALFETKNWENEAQIGSVFLTKLKYVYNRTSHGDDVAGLYEKNLNTVDVVSQIRDNQEYEITDLDHYYEFFGGLAKSVEIVKGGKAAMYITDTTGDKVVTETVDKAINRGIRTRVLNPLWINGMLQSKYHGAQKIAERFENVMGLAATTNSVESWIYDDLHKSYVEDDVLRQRMIDNNPHAYMGILEQMMEYYNRGYWNASEEQLASIRKAYLELEDRIEETV